ncbi:MAG: hypothetical protein JXB05_26415 [Myxococcaceae bacterium]|nr:hypothetical protein [Myxococcaceae bacterium]
MALSHQRPELDSVNGLSANGFSTNGLSANGFSTNGLSANGFSTNGLSANGFSSWFTQDAALAEMVMRYLVRCAAPAGQTRTYTHPQTGQQYTWNGGLGLAPSWANGAPASRTEQQVITACLMAHVNRYGLSIPISVLGRDAMGALIPFTHQELGIFSAREACFFGNLFTQEGLFFGVDRPFTNEAMYLTRACAGMGGGGDDPATSCAPFSFVGACWQSCLPDNGGPFYRTCYRNGVAYQALTTRMRHPDYAQLFQGLNEEGGDD